MPIPLLKGWVTLMVQTASNQGFTRTAQADLDSRRRLSLGKIGKPEHTRYEISENSLGEILLVPLVSVPAREMIVWENAQVRKSLLLGMEQAVAGELVERESLAQYFDEDEDEDEDSLQ